MDYRIESRPACKVVCKTKQVKIIDGKTASSDISAFWAQSSSDGTIRTLCAHMQNPPTFGGLLGIGFTKDMTNNSFLYAIGAEWDGTPVNPPFEIVEIPSYTYAVFPCVGKMPDAFVKTYKQICDDFFPSASYEYFGGIELEVYPSANTQNPDYSCEIWISVKEKN